MSEEENKAQPIPPTPEPAPTPDAVPVLSKAMKMLIEKSTKPEVQASLPAIAGFIHQERNNLKNCPFCNSHIEDRIESIYAELIHALYLVKGWCEAKGVHEFTMKEVRHLLGQINYTRFGNLVHYGGVVYPIKAEKNKRRRGHFGINLTRANEVFANTRAFPMSKKIDMITGEVIEETRVYVRDIPALAKFIDPEGVYRPELFVKVPEIVPSAHNIPPVTI